MRNIVRMTTVCAALLAALAVGGYATYPGDRPSLLDREMAATVMVSDATGHGSGVAIAPDLVLTAAHVVDGAQAFTVKTSDGAEYPAEVLWASPSRDLALLKVAPADGGGMPDLAPARLACRAPALDEAVTLIGNPVVARWRVAHGTVASRLSIDNAGLNSTDVALDISIAGGDSGGPLFDANGDVIGIARATLIQPLSSFAATFIGIGVMTPSVNACELLGGMA